MNAQTCACPGCNCKLGEHPVVSEGRAYCCQACAEHHPSGKPCNSSGCGCAASPKR
ncbi:metallothionein [Pseudomonas donghuensis]|uniref:metallothionein n=1 Tax=Pseudomonas donghuensis TaxID=1163398 RepID=UPI000C2B0000|nr:metallothionein [Pseudomonas donghuensis]PJY93711.1 metallothionein [Pseudomonas donghuensis]WKY26307.1 metallothionein [Pseudomonas donghuensis]